MKSKLHNGQSIVEVIIMLAVVIMIVTGLVSGTVASMKSTNYASDKSLATKYSQEGMELARGDRDTSWSTFFARAGSSYCLGSDKVFVLSNLCTANVDNKYTRTAQFSWDNANSRMTVIVTVTWQDGAGTHTSQLTSYFTKWR